MSEIELNLGDQLVDNATSFTFDYTTTSGTHVFRDPNTGSVRELDDSAVLSAYTQRRLTSKPVVADDDPNWMKANMARPITSQPREYRDIVSRRLAYVNAIINAGMPGRQRDTWPAILAKEAQARNEAPPPWTTARRWVKRFLERKSARGLIPGFKGRGRHPLIFPAAMEERMGREIMHYLSDTRPRMAVVIRRVQHAIRVAKDEDPLAHDWHVPSENLIRRRIRELCPYQVAEARYGKKIADQMFRGVEKGEVARFRLEVVEIDHTTADIIIVDDEHRILYGRPTICAAIDKRTRALVGIYIGFEPPGEFTLLQCIRNMLEPKTYMAKEFPDIKLKWKPFGKPVVVVLDNAKENHSETVREILATINIDVRFAPVRTPQFKGTIERFFKTLNDTGLTWLPGKTFSNILEKGEYDSEKNACMTLRDFRRHLHLWIVAEYMPSYHSGVLGSPEMLWDKEVAEMPIRLTDVDQAMIDSTFGRTKTAKVSRHGIRMEGLIFQCRELEAIARLPEDKREVLVTMNHENIGEISVLHPITHQTFRVGCHLREAKGVSLYQHKRIREFLVENVHSRLTDRIYLEGKTAYFASIDEALQKRPKSNVARRAALRGLGGSRTAQPRTSASTAGVDEDIFGVGQDSIHPRFEVESDTSPADTTTFETTRID